MKNVLKNKGKHLKSSFGFTLIELLAVIIILAIIALIAVPTILNIIDKSKKSTLEQTANGMIRAGELYYNEKLLNNVNEETSKTFVGPDYGVLEIKGKKVKDGAVIVEKNKVTIWLYEDGTCVYGSNEKGIKTEENISDKDKCSEKIEVPPTVPTYENGTAVYFNPVSGLKCNDYTASQSSGDSNTGCLKWYIFNDKDGKDTVNMILDHNTTYMDYWNLSGSNTSGPSTATGEVLGDLKAKTDGWIGVATRTDSYIDPAEGYTIDYSGYRARLIEANEVWEITSLTNQVPNWDSGNTSPSYFYFEGSQLSGQGTSKYPWMYDYTNSCTSVGCNTANSNTYGYWTSSANASGSSYAWIVNSGGSLGGNNVNNRSSRGVRPVITIDKSIIS